MSECFIIAEIGVNHNGSMELAKELVLRSKESGADAVKFQSFSADRLVTKAASRAEYQKQNTGSDASQHALLKGLELSEEAHLQLAEFCRINEIEFLSTPFDVEAVGLLESCGVKRYKIASGEITNTPLLDAIARTGKPCILSTGMSTLEDVESALLDLYASYHDIAGSGDLSYDDLVRKDLQNRVSVLHCTSIYPCPLEFINLRCITTLMDRFNLVTGLSDHSAGLEVALAAVAMGARVIEKHVTTSRDLPGPDHMASMEPGDFARLVQMIRNVEVALGSPTKEPVANEPETARLVRKGVFARKPIKKGDIFSVENIVVKRPLGKMSPRQFGVLLGRAAQSNYELEAPIDEPLV